MEQEEQKAINIKTEAEKIAVELVSTAKETARQMLLSTNLDISKIPLICDRIGVIKSDLAELKQLMIFNNTDQEKRIKSLELTRAEQTGFKMSWREILGWGIGISGVIVAIITVWVQHKQ